jgi:hypothetical protein
MITTMTLAVTLSLWKTGSRRLIICLDFNPILRYISFRKELLMDTVYCVLVRWGTEWDGQSIYYTNSKALFDQILLVNHTYGSEGIGFDSFSKELKENIIAVRKAFKWENPEVELENDEDISLTEAMEWLECCSPSFPVILAGETELTCSWNW